MPIVSVANVEKERPKRESPVTIGVLGSEMILRCQWVDPGACIVMHLSVGCDGHSECPPAELIEFTDKKITSETISPDLQERGVFLLILACFATKVNSHARPVGFVRGFAATEEASRLGRSR